MSQLWPRLGPVPAREMYVELAGLDVPTLLDRSSAEHPRLTYAATGGARVSSAAVSALTDDLRTAAQECGYPHIADSAQRRTFDRLAAEVLYRQMDITTVEAAVDQVWNFMALVAAPDIVGWRWAGSENQERWICTDRTRHMFARLWWQARTFVLDTDIGPDFSLLRPLSERDLNQITERKVIGGIPPLARALARLVSSERNDDAVGSQLLRALTPLLRRHVMFVDFASLSDEQIDDHLRALRASVSL